MGMDVYRKNPTSETGGYFRRNVWGWHRLAAFITDTCPPELTAKCESWHDNSGCGLEAAADAAELAELLDAKAKNGDAAAYVRARDERLAALPDETCELCSGTGIRTDEIGKASGQADPVIDISGHPRHGQTGWNILADAGVTTAPLLDWFHIGMRLQHLRQIANGLSCDNPSREAAKAVIVEEVERLHWRLWNGKATNARLSIDRIRAVMHHFKGDAGARKSITPSGPQNLRQAHTRNSQPPNVLNLPQAVHRLNSAKYRPAAASRRPAHRPAAPAQSRPPDHADTDPRRPPRSAPAAASAPDYSTRPQ
jgi:hypothetical protein